MNIDNGHLIRDTEDNWPKVGTYVPVPDELKKDAEKALDGKKETHINLTDGSRLSEFARQARNKRNKQAKASRRKNRK